MSGSSASARPALALVLLLAAHAGCTAPAPPPPAAAGPRIVLVGLDGADWQAIDALADTGALPALARLRRFGRTGTLVAPPPLLSPIIWTTIATGRQPEDHGVLDFMEDLPGGGQAPVSASSRRVPALWNAFSDAGRSVAVVGWWASWPAEAVRGTIVSDRVAPQLARPDGALDPHAIAPAAQASALAGLVVHASQVTLPELGRYVSLTEPEYEQAMAAGRDGSARLYENRLAHLSAVVAGTRTYAAMAERLATGATPDFLAVYLEGIDTVSHLFVRDKHRGPSATAAAYRDADALVAALAASSALDTWIVVCSDHGFQPASAAAAIADDPADFTGPAAAWHRPYGIVAAASAGVISGRVVAPSPQDVGFVAPVDLAPTILHAAGLAIGDQMPGRVVEGLLPPGAAARPVRRAPIAFRPVAAPEAASAPDPAAVARLQALGYVAGRTTSLARQNLGEILFRRGRFDDAVRHLRAVADAQPQNLSARLWLAQALRGLGRDREALDVYRESIRLPGGVRAALVEAVALATTRGAPGDADRVMAAAVAAPGDRGRVHAAQAVIAAAAGRRAVAETELEAALAADPVDVDALSRLLDLLLPAQRARDVLPFAQRAAGAAPGSPRHQALLGEGLLAAGQPGPAAAAFERALALAPDSPAVRLDLARAQIAVRRPADAEATLAPLGASAERSLLLGAAAAALGRWSDAAAHYETVLREGPPTPELLNGLGWARHQQGRDDDARDLLRRSLALNGRQPVIRKLLAQLDPGAQR